MNKISRFLILVAAFAIATVALTPVASAQSCGGGVCNGVGWTVVYTNNSSSSACFTFTATISYGVGGTCSESSAACGGCAQSCAPTIQCQYSQNWGATGGTCTLPGPGDTVVVRVVNCNIGFPGCLTGSIACT